MVRNRGPVAHELIVVRRGSAGLPLRADGITVDEEALEPLTAGALEPGGCRPSASAAGPLDARPLRAVLQHVRPLPRRDAHRAGGADSGARPRVQALRRPRPSRHRRDPRDVRAVVGGDASRCRSGRPRARSTGRRSCRSPRGSATLAERYVSEVLLVRSGAQADPGVHGRRPARERRRAARRRRGPGGQRRRRRGRRSAGKSASMSAPSSSRSAGSSTTSPRPATRCSPAAPLDSVPLTRARAHRRPRSGAARSASSRRSRRTCHSNAARTIAAERRPQRRRPDLAADRARHRRAAHVAAPRAGR